MLIFLISVLLYKEARRESADFDVSSFYTYNDVDLAITYDNLGWTFQELDEYVIFMSSKFKGGDCDIIFTNRTDKARTYYKQALEIHKKNEHIEALALTLNNLAFLSPNDAKSYLEAAESTIHSLPGTPHSSVC